MKHPIKKFAKKLQIDFRLNIFDKTFQYRYDVRYNRTGDGLLTRLCELYGSDKGGTKKDGHPYQWEPHTYTDFYAQLFDHCRMSVTKVFECGLGTNSPDVPSSMGPGGKPGASLRAWRDYFPNAQIRGADIDKKILFEEGRIKTFYVDQTNELAVLDMWKTVSLTDFDLIVDDGLHTFDAGVCFFENSISKLASDGIYVIEDVSVGRLQKFQKYFRGKSYRVDFVSLFQEGVYANSSGLVVIRNP